ncbi:hypothetical protein Ae717Ps2_5765c [Pseudonocardia sp. Ae717_Ps2]|nr:hypothetical protein Ae717Ps2_5765c [Pseudonocardia sp. Ae717_Ps2]
MAGPDRHRNRPPTARLLAPPLPLLAAPLGWLLLGPAGAVCAAGWRGECGAGSPHVGPRTGPGRRLRNSPTHSGSPTSCAPARTPRPRWPGTCTTGRSPARCSSRPRSPRGSVSRSPRPCVGRRGARPARRRAGRLGLGARRHPRCPARRPAHRPARRHPLADRARSPGASPARRASGDGVGADRVAVGRNRSRAVDGHRAADRAAHRAARARSAADRGRPHGRGGRRGPTGSCVRRCRRDRGRARAPRSPWSSAAGVPDRGGCAGCVPSPERRRPRRRPAPRSSRCSFPPGPRSAEPSAGWAARSSAPRWAAGCCGSPGGQPAGRPRRWTPRIWPPPGTSWRPASPPVSPWRTPSEPRPGGSTARPVRRCAGSRACWRWAPTPTTPGPPRPGPRTRRVRPRAGRSARTGAAPRTLRRGPHHPAGALLPARLPGPRHRAGRDRAGRGGVRTVVTTAARRPGPHSAGPRRRRHR